ncbi:ShlB/FhaC/HecB family hemolysin secretion/activation protein [Erwinia pyrifoliae]|uniref:ShlB/FhaC/HecB family hemolysin secretion/activation protein n=1 Tax=Erwinia pyrifoliae TaxID=79967 RepID=UPI0021FC22C6|nr:ShlB/FhaC/HecB family hemolysin secretion/activation protein [Erwinia pyrifoliae]UWS29221.1 ShlB/FhaC/HecB family hemolysin secretion/activation protein [Erwinia pyrifoliae]
MSIKTRTCLAMCVGLFMTESAIAAPLTPGDRDFIQNQQQQRLLQDRQQGDALWQAASPPGRPAALSAQAGPCFPLHHILIRNATLISASQQSALSAPYINRCLNLTQINSLVYAISDWYIQRGYITSRAFLSEQDLSSGQLIIPVLEGKLEAIRLDGHSSRELKMVFPRLTGRILNLRDIEQGMEQINRVRSTPVQIDIQPSVKPGYSVVNLTAKPESPLGATLGVDNSGQQSTGVGQLNASVTGNNLLGLADRWFISGGRSSAFSDWRDARSLQAGISVPYGYGLLDYSYSWSNYHSDFVNNGFSWLSNGDNIAHRLNGSWVLYRNGGIKTGVQFGVNRYSSHHYLNDALLQSSSRKITSLQLGLNHTQKVAGGVATLNPTFSRGMPWFEAESDEGKNGNLAKAQFRKWSIGGSYQRPLTNKLWWLSSLYGQWSPDRLYGSERLTLGGESSVRGFKQQYLSGDAGGYLRNELDYSLFRLALLGEVSALAAVDGGWLKSDALNSQLTGTLWGSAMGIGTRNPHFYTQYTVGIPLSYPGYLQPDRLSTYARFGLVF